MRNQCALHPLGKTPIGRGASGEQNERRSSMGKGHRDKVAVVAGAAEGLGQAFALRLAEDGVHIVIADRKGADDTVKKIKAHAREALAVSCDVSSESDVAAL